MATEVAFPDRLKSLQSTIEDMQRVVLDLHGHSTFYNKVHSPEKIAQMHENIKLAHEDLEAARLRLLNTGEVFDGTIKPL